MHSYRTPMRFLRGRIGKGRKPRTRSSAQAMVEFAIVLPLLLVVVFGVIEVGRLVYIKSAVINASREAVRFGSAWGSMGTGYQFRDCAGIRAVAKKVAIMVPLQDSDITITYDGSSGIPLTGASICDAASGQDLDVKVNSGDRIIVTVSTNYSPIVSLVPLSSFPISSTSRRTILGIITLFQPTPTPSP